MKKLFFFTKYFGFITKLHSLLNTEERIQFVLVMLAVLAMALFQALGIAALLPFIDLIINPDVVFSNHWMDQLYQKLNFSSTRSFTIFLGTIALGIIVFGNIISAFATWLKFRYVWRVSHRISVTLLSNYLYSPYAYFLNQNTADLGKNILYEIQELTIGFLTRILRLFTGILTVIVIFILLLVVNWQMTLTIMSAFALLYLTLFLGLAKTLKSSGEKKLFENSMRFKLAGEALSGIKDIKVSGREDFFLQNFAAHSRNFTNLQTWFDIVDKIPRFLLEIVAFGGIIVIMLFLVLVGRNDGSIIPLMGFFAFAGYRLMPALYEIFNSFSAFRFNKALLNKIHNDLSVQIDVQRKKARPSSRSESFVFNQVISLKQVSFAYDEGGVQVLKNISIEIPHGSTIAVVGTTGSGKTTLIDIILGLLKPTNGSISVDGVEINEITTKLWQERIGYVPQQVYLIDNTVASNIAFGVPQEDIDMNQVIRVSKIANLDEFVVDQLKDGYETNVGERGVKLSGGQRQRIGIARALYHNPDVLVLDEATSSLDSITEREVLKAIDNVSKYKTMIIISHKLATIKKSNTIYVLEKGEVACSGTFSQLLKKCTQFRSLAKNVE